MVIDSYLPPSSRHHIGIQDNVSFDIGLHSNETIAVWNYNEINENADKNELVQSKPNLSLICLSEIRLFPMNLETNYLRWDIILVPIDSILMVLQLCA